MTYGAAQASVCTWPSASLVCLTDSARHRQEVSLCSPINIPQASSHLSRLHDFAISTSPLPCYSHIVFIARDSLSFLLKSVLFSEPFCIPAFSGNHALTCRKEAPATQMGPAVLSASWLPLPPAEDPSPVGLSLLVGTGSLGRDKMCCPGSGCDDFLASWVGSSEG